jgi:hypothetical protein
MDSDKNWGIVLKHNIHSTHTTHLLDRKLGKIEVVIRDKKSVRVCRGAVLTYLIEDHTRTHKVHALDIIHIPLELAQQDILFLHHVLEICFYFIPASINHEAVFDLLIQVYKKHKIWDNRTIKKWYLMKFFMGIGMYPEIAAHSSLVGVADIHIEDILDSITDWNINEAELDAWLLECLYMHPHISVFKTVHFLTNNR